MHPIFEPALTLGWTNPRSGPPDLWIFNLPITVAKGLVGAGLPLSLKATIERSVPVSEKMYIPVAPAKGFKQTSTLQARKNLLLDRLRSFAGLLIRR